jgi:hypothetical protein
MKKFTGKRLLKNLLDRFVHETFFPSLCHVYCIFSLNTLLFSVFA